jgi:enoyl-CoA hydratase/carnithine racemase
MIALLSDIAVTSDRATFRAPELLRGLADMVFASVLPAVVGVPRSRDLLLTGRTLDAAEAEAWGLVTRVVGHDQLMSGAVEAVRALTAAGPAARVEVRQALHRNLGLVERGVMDHSLRSPECVEGFAAFKQRRSPSWVPGPESTPLPPWAAEAE